MKSKFLLVLAMAAGSTVCSAQNLVPNGSFEEGLECPSFIANLDAQCSNWFGSLVDEDITQTPTPDWFHECSEFETLSPPNVAFGFQEPLDGVAYAGIGTYSLNDPNYREIIGVELNSPLNIGQPYLISYFVSRLSKNGVNFATNNMGFKLTTYPTFNTSDFPDNDPTFSIDTVISDTTSWIEVTHEIVADSAYGFIHIGNFFNDNNTETLQFNVNATNAYYVIDDVSLTSTLSSVQQGHSRILHIYPNPTERFVKIKSDEEIFNYSLYTLNGRLIKTDKGDNQSLVEMDMEELPSGVYMLHLTTRTTSYYERVVKK
jgi:hypothetical protein